MSEAPTRHDVSEAALQLETKQLGELQESRNELLSRVQNLKKDLQDWRFKLDSQVKTYRTELGDLRKTLNTEVDQLRTEFQELRHTLREQLEATSSLAIMDDEQKDE
mmetsp:Transcript_9607/g.13050  ORF Transcript_9607/g.13050 Transcript_9607/m.13050 type:complete len:107 (+) Transcript_9607:110-430(+)|eukprot:CAMPEP_0196583936 /NCGR_PEP_ID=MMETSP1081-20130531/45255_1 /TAXON_ID=36882 /ORGANISM="Pyramimonas amylifera, Strain CCMP720" /LENGTH=106 /DNA_ID=CAMNT_0041904975 /DNA_START=110 /DNA_END=430 /DNA_ORIENTATION=+